MLRRTVTFAVLSVVAIALGRSTAQPETGLALMWPAAGVGALWTLRARSDREVALAVALMGIFAAVGNGVTGFPVPAALVLGMSTAVACYSIRRIMGPVDDTAVALHRLSHFYRLLAAGGVGTALSAAIGMVGIDIAGVSPSWSAGAGWWLRNMTAIVVIAAPALTLGARRQRLTRPILAEAALVYGLTVVTLYAVFAPGHTLPLAFVPLAFIVWAALRLPLPLAAVEGGLIAVGALVMLRTTGGGPIGAIDDPLVRALVLQGFMMLAATLALVLATVHAELDEVMDGLTEAGRRAEEAAAGLRTLIADAPYGMVVVDPDGRILEANNAMAAMFECTVADIIGSGARSFSTRPPEEVREYLHRAVEAGGEAVTTDWATHSLAGRPLHLAVSSRLLTAHSGRGQILVNAVDVSERRRSEERLSHLASHDALSGLPNRRRFEEVLARHRDLCATHGQRGALLLVDLDHFKEVNDTQGHAVGDDLIRSVADVLRVSLRSSDTVARLGGDEFAVLLPDADTASADLVAATLVRAVREHCAALDGAQQQVTASVGGVTFEEAARRGGDVMGLADERMYEAKASGRDGYAVMARRKSTADVA
jgi:diguanylate cyclase (GGDEF)-like protein/PAS domain S-box-containing protein